MMPLPKMKIEPWGAELWQGGIMVAKVEGSCKASVDREIQHYAMMYVQDGPVEIKLKRPQQTPGA